MKRVLAFLGSCAVCLPVMGVQAAPYPGADPCTYLGAHCSTSTAGVLTMANTFGGAVATFLAIGGGALAVIYVVVGGFQMLLSYGDDSKLTRGKTSVQWALVGFGLVLGSQMVVNFVAMRAGGALTATPLLSLMTTIVDSLLLLMNVFFVIIVCAAGLKAILSRGKQEDYTQAKHAVGYALAGALVMNLARALAGAVFNILG